MIRGMLSATPETADPDGAVADFSAVIEQDSTDSDAYLRRSMILAVMNRFDPAIADCKRAQTLAPNNPTIPRVCQELSAKRVQFERLMQARARYAQRYQEMESVAWIALAAIIGGFYAGGAPMLPPL